MDDPHGDGSGRAPLVLLCRANLIRSPLAGAILRARLDERGRRDLPVATAGLQVDADDMLPRTAVDVAAELGVDLLARSARAARADQIRGAGLLVTMTESQRAAVERLASGTIARTFTLHELIRLLRGAGVDGPVDGWSTLARAAHRARPLVPPAEAPEDLPDPVGRDLEFHRRVAREIAARCEELAGLVADRDG